MAIHRFQMRGGPHDGVQLDPSVRGPNPETLFRISYGAGVVYARAGEQLRDGRGLVREVFDFDADGSLTERARRRFTSVS
jgi:hypothetical protein